MLRLKTLPANATAARFPKVFLNNHLWTPVSSPSVVFLRHLASYSDSSKPEVPKPRLEHLRRPGDDPDKYRSTTDGTFAGRVILPDHESSYPHVNVLDFLDRPEPTVHLIPTLSASQVDTIPGLFADKEDKEAAKKILEDVNALGPLPSWPAIEEKYPELEVQLSRIQNLKSGDKVVVVGAGISGLTLAWFLGHARPDLNITVLEQKNQVGGWMQTDKVTLGTNEQTEILEWGPRTLQATHAGTSLIRIMLNRMGVLDTVFRGVPKESPSNRKALLHQGRPTPLPSSRNEVVKFLMSPISKGIKLSPFKDLLMPARKAEVRDESVESYIVRRFGQSIASRFVSAIMRGIYASDISKLSARSVARLGKTYASEIDNPSMISSMLNGEGRGSDAYAAKSQIALLHALVGLPYEDTLAEMSKYTVAVLNEGISSLAKLVEEDLEVNLENVKVIKNNPVCQITPSADGSTVTVKSKEDEIKAQWVVSTIPGYSLSSIIESTDKELSSQIDNSLSYTTVGVVNVTTPHKFVGHNWFGYLVPREEDGLGNNPHGLLGVIFNTAVRNGAREINRTELPHPHEVFATTKKDEKERGESFLDNFDTKPFEDEHIRRSLMTDSPLVDKDNKPIIGDPPLPDQGNITLMFGGSLWSDLSREELPSDEKLIAATKEIFRKQLDTDLEAEEDVKIQVKIQYKCIPLYAVGHRERIQALKDSVSKKYNNRLTLTGMSFGRGAGIGDNVLDSFWLAARHCEERKLLFPAFYLNQTLALNYPSLLK